MTVSQAKARVERARREVEKQADLWKTDISNLFVRDRVYEAIGRRKEAESVLAAVRRASRG